MYTYVSPYVHEIRTLCYQSSHFTRVINLNFKYLCLLYNLYTFYIL